MVPRSNTYYFKSYLKENSKKNIKFTLERPNIRPPRHLARLIIWKGALGILDPGTQENYLKITWIQRLLNLTNALWNDLMLCQLKLQTQYLFPGPI